MERFRKRVPMASLALVVLGMVLVVGPASANHVEPGDPTTTLDVEPEGIHGNPSCASAGPAGDFLFEFKLEPVTSGTFPLAFDGLSGSVTVDVYNTDDGQAFDFSFTGDFVAAAIIVKGGPNANFYDYVAAGFDPGASADTFLHAPVNLNNDRHYGLSHISFCVAQAPAELEILKSAVEETITIGEHAAFDITVNSLGPSTALGVTLDDTLPNTELDWEVVSENPDMSACTITSGNTLECAIGDMDAGDSFTVRVQTTDPIASEDEFCGETLANTAFADADNADQVSDDADIDVECPDVKVEKSGNGTINEGTDAVFSITVTNLGPGTATAVVLADDLPNTGLGWSVISEDIANACTITDSLLECVIGDMPELATFEVVVKSPTRSDDCGDKPNAAEVSASNEDPNALGNNTASDTITILCGAIQISKTAKHADDPGGTSANLVATFTIVDNEGNVHTITTDADGFGCADGVALGITQSITETSVPEGYAAPNIANHNVVAGECTDGTADGGVEVAVENIPLTDLSITVMAQWPGATFSTIVCVDESDVEVGNSGAFGDPAELEVDDLEPGTYVCTIVIDP